MTTRRAPALLLAVWLLGALLATGVGLLAVRQVRAQVSDPAAQPLSASDVRRAVATATALPSALPSGRPTARPTPTRTSASRPLTPVAPARAPVRRTFSTSGGSVAVECRGRAPSIVYVLPASGWAVDKRDVEGGVVDVRFRAGNDDVRVRVACSAAGAPVAVADD